LEDRWQESFELGSPRSGPRYSTSLRGSLFAHDVSWEPPSASIPRCADARCHNHLLRCPSFRQHEGRSHPVWQIRANHWRDVARQRSRTLLHGLRGRIQPARILGDAHRREKPPSTAMRSWLAAFSDPTGWRPNVQRGEISTTRRRLSSVCSVGQRRRWQDGVGGNRGNVAAFSRTRVLRAT